MLWEELLIILSTKKKTDTSAYKVQILTVATSLDGMKPQLGANTCQLGEHKGAAGHVLLKYPSGGFLLVSCGHWIELSKLDVSVSNLLKVAANDFGEEYSKKIEKEISSLPQPMQYARTQQYAQQFVQQAQPCLNMYSPQNRSNFSSTYSKK